MIILNRLTGLGLMILGLITALYPQIFTDLYKVGLDDPTARTVVAAIIGGGEIGIGIALFLTFEKKAEAQNIEARTKLRFNALMIAAIVMVRLTWTLFQNNFSVTVISEIVIELLLLVILFGAWRRWVS